MSNCNKVDLKNILKGLTIVLLLMLFVVSIATYFGQYNLMLDNLSNFRFQIFVTSLTTLIVVLFETFCLKLNKIFLLISVLSLLLNLIEVNSYLISQKEPSNNVKGIRIFYSNVLTRNQGYNDLIKSIEKEQPDVILLLEVNDKWIKKIIKIRNHYKYAIDSPRSDNFGLSVYSKIKLKNVNVNYFNFNDVFIPYIIFDASINNQPVGFIFLHTTPPYDELHFNSRNEELKLLTKLVKSRNIPNIVVGDLNCTHYTYFYKKLLSETSLFNPRQKFGNTPTWPTTMNSFFQIPIDSILASKNLKINSFKIADPIGSDHFPIIADISNNNS